MDKIKETSKIAPVKKNDEIIVDIIDYGMNGEGIAKVDNYTIFIPGAIKNEKCKIHIIKVLKTHAFAKLINIIKSSEYRVNKIDCSTFEKCGGCSLRHIQYEETINIKRDIIQNNINKVLKSKIKANNTIGMDEPLYYRNKAIYPINLDKKVGIFKNLSHDIIPFKECKIQTKISQNIARFITENWNSSIYNESTGKGILRNIMIREGFKTNEIMVVLVLNSNEFKREYFDIEKLINQFKNIKSVIANFNTKNTNVILSNDNKIIFGEPYINDILCDKTFKISANSFYQVNPIQTEKIYNLAIKEAKLNKNDILCDLYCGIGTIGIIASDKVKKVYGIEINRDAIQDAKLNAKINNVGNIEFINDDVEIAFNNLLNENKKPTVVIVDPPRKGLDNRTIENLKQLKLGRIVYISCNPSTLIRDLSLLEDNYYIKTITPIDNFCYTSHIESVTLLELK